MNIVLMVVYFILYFQFLMRGLEIMILRVGVPLACVGLIDNGKGVFKAYLNKFFQATLAVLIQLCLSKLGVGLMLNKEEKMAVGSLLDKALCSYQDEKTADLLSGIYNRVFPEEAEYVAQLLADEDELEM